MYIYIDNSERHYDGKLDWHVSYARMNSYNIFIFFIPSNQCSC